MGKLNSELVTHYRKSLFTLNLAEFHCNASIVEPYFCMQALEILIYLTKWGKC
jgi:hypothetical protein